MRKSLLALAVAVAGAAPAHAYLASDARLEGKLIRFDERKLVLQDGAKRFEVPRSWIPDDARLVPDQRLVIVVPLADDVPEDQRPPEVADAKVLRTDPKWTELEFEGVRIKLPTRDIASTRIVPGEVVEVPFAAAHRASWPKRAGPAKR
jgi:hypothetical protein